VALIREAEPGSNLCDRGFSRLENALRAFDPGAPQVRHGALAGTEPELPGEMEPAHTGLAGQVIQRNALTDVCFDVRPNTLQGPPGQAASEMLSSRALYLVATRQKPQNRLTAAPPVSRETLYALPGRHAGLGFSGSPHGQKEITHRIPLWQWSCAVSTLQTRVRRASSRQYCTLV
jgi:hypothetical protein